MNEEESCCDKCLYNTNTCIDKPYNWFFNTFCWCFYICGIGAGGPCSCDECIFTLGNR